MLRRVKDKGRFSDAYGTVSLFPGVARGRRFSVSERSRRRAASRIEQRSISATKSKTFPPRRPERAAMHEADRQDHAFRVKLTEKLLLLLAEECVGRGHFPRNSSTPARRRRTS